jgi:hypothetical protein
MIDRSGLAHPSSASDARSPMPMTAEQRNPASSVL